MSSFKPNHLQRWETHSSVSHGDRPRDDLSLYVSAHRDDQIIRFSALTEHGSSSIKLTAERARELAAELIAAADSLQTVAEAA